MSLKGKLRICAGPIETLADDAVLIGYTQITHSPAVTPAAFMRLSCAGGVDMIPLQSGLTPDALPDLNRALAENGFYLANASGPRKQQDPGAGDTVHEYSIFEGDLYKEKP